METTRPETHADETGFESLRPLQIFSISEQVLTGRERRELRDGKSGRATGVLVLCDGRIQGGDSYFYYAGNYTFRNGKWRGELVSHQHSKAVGKNLAFGGREVSCGFTGTYSDGQAEVDGTALVGKTSVSFHAELSLKEKL
jgi:hypothetical protein